MSRLKSGLIFERQNKAEKKKKQYRNKYSERVSYFFGEIFEFEDGYHYYPNARNYVHRRISTKQECSLYQIHEIEYAREYNLRLRAKRSPRNLPTSWDDLYCEMYDVEKSWKHSTKRKKQYYK